MQPTEHTMIHEDEEEEEDMPSLMDVVWDDLEEEDRKEAMEVAEAEEEKTFEPE
jgi:hypothetical protein